MISAQDIERAREASADFKPVILAARYHRDTDRVELVAAWCTLLVDRLHIEELRALSPHDLETISVSDYGIHVSGADIDINAAGLLAYLAKQIEAEATASR
jgi:hypothetical protein